MRLEAARSDEEGSFKTWRHLEALCIFENNQLRGDSEEFPAQICLLQTAAEVLKAALRCTYLRRAGRDWGTSAARC